MFERSQEINEKDSKVYFSNNTERVYVVDRIEIAEKCYKTEMVIVAEMGNNDLLQFCQIEKMFVINKEVHFVINLFKTIYFDSHVYAYKVKKSNIFLCKNPNMFPDINPCLLVEIDDCTFIMPKYLL